MRWSVLTCYIYNIDTRPPNLELGHWQLNTGHCTEYAKKHWKGHVTLNAGNVYSLSAMDLGAGTGAEATGGGAEGLGKSSMVTNRGGEGSRNIG